jgi:bifunctional non-homologous end joining protein LigD
VTSLEVEGREVALSNLDRVLWPEAGYTKGRLIDYYVRAGPALLPHLAGRPITLRRFPEGVDGAGWYQTRCPPAPPWVRKVRVAGRGERAFDMCLIEDLAGLVWAANLGTLELHPFLWAVPANDRPSWLVLDLDPGPPADILDAARVALRLRDALRELGLESYAKTSGSMGLHVYVPLNTPVTFAETKAAARALAERLARAEPDRVIAHQRRALRVGKVLVDWLQNDPWRSTVAPYSLRALPWPTVSAPVSWAELEEAVADRRVEVLVLEPSEALDRLERLGDLFAPVLELRQRLPV